MSGLALIAAGILGWSLACGDLASGGIEATGTPLVISHRASEQARYERKAGLAPPPQMR